MLDERPSLRGRMTIAAVLNYQIKKMDLTPDWMPEGGDTPPEDLEGLEILQARGFDDPWFDDLLIAVTGDASMGLRGERVHPSG